MEQGYDGGESMMVDVSFDENETEVKKHVSVSSSDFCSLSGWSHINC